MMKKITKLMLIVSALSFTNCRYYDDDDFHYYNDNNYEYNYGSKGVIKYKDYKFDLNHASIENYSSDDNGVYYRIKLSTNTLKYNGKTYDAFLNLTVYLKNDHNFSGEYKTDKNYIDTRYLNFIEFYIDPKFKNGNLEVGKSKLDVYNKDFERGKIYINRRHDGTMFTNFELTDRDGNKVRGNFNGSYTN